MPTTNVLNEVTQRVSDAVDLQYTTEDARRVFILRVAKKTGNERRIPLSKTLAGKLFKSILAREAYAK